MSKYLALDGDKRILTSSKKRGGGERGRRGGRREGLGGSRGAAAATSFRSVYKHYLQDCTQERDPVDNT